MCFPVDCPSKYLKQPFELGKVGVMIDTSQMEPEIDLLKQQSKDEDTRPILLLGRLSYYEHTGS